MCDRKNKGMCVKSKPASATAADTRLIFGFCYRLIRTCGREICSKRKGDRDEEAPTTLTPTRNKASDHSSSTL